MLFYHNLVGRRGYLWRFCIIMNNRFNALSTYIFMEDFRPNREIFVCQRMKANANQFYAYQIYSEGLCLNLPIVIVLVARLSIMVVFWRWSEAKICVFVLIPFPYIILPDEQNNIHWYLKSVDKLKTKWDIKRI